MVVSSPNSEFSDARLPKHPHSDGEEEHSYIRSPAYRTDEGDSSDWREIHRRGSLTAEVVDLTTSSPATRAPTDPEPAI
jgi:hypothetical protein